MGVKLIFQPGRSVSVRRWEMGSSKEVGQRRMGRGVLGVQVASVCAASWESKGVGVASGRGSEFG